MTANRLRAGIWLWVPALFVGICAADDMNAATLPCEATGPIHFWADGARLLDPAGNPELLITLSVFQDELRCEAPEGEENAQADLDLTLATLTRDGSVMLKQGLRLPVPCIETDDEPARAERLLYLGAPMQPGTAAIEIVLSDRNAPRIELVPKMRNEKQSGVARGFVERDGVREGRGLSGLVFLAAPPASDLLTRKAGFGFGPADSLRRLLEPNPPRRFGLRNPTMRVYAEAYGLAGGEGELTVQLREWGEPDGLPLWEQRASVAWEWPRCAVLAAADLSSLPAGTYEVILEFAPWGETIEPFRTAGRLQVNWSPAFWNQTQSAIVEEAGVLLPEEQRMRLLALEPGQREALLDSLWLAIGDAKRAGVPGRQQVLFHERVEFADSHYGWSIHRGATTDRGRTYIRFGAPDEIHKELSPQWKDQIYYYLQRRSGAETGEWAPGRANPHWLDDAAYEVWSYTGRGRPLVEEWSPPSHGNSLEFIFVDRLGTGDYRLIQTNLLGGF